jgi:hypothetical protein
VTRPSTNPSLEIGSTAILQGTAGLNLRELVVEGPEETNQVRWINATTWQATPTLRLGQNTVRLRGRDSTGALVVDSEWVITSSAAGGGIDADGDQMPDAWERRYALNPGLDDRLLDADGDGQSNRDEFLSGTDPRDRQSLLRLRVTPVVAGTEGISGGSVRLRWDAKAGRSYTLLEASGTGTITWKRHADIAAEADDRMAEISVPLPVTGDSRLFRLVSPIQP